MASIANLCRARLALNPLCRIGRFTLKPIILSEISISKAPLCRSLSSSSNNFLVQTRLISFWRAKSSHDGFGSRFARKVKTWSVAFAVTFLLIYSAIYNSITTVLLEYLKMQTYSMPLLMVEDKSEEQDANK